MISTTVNGKTLKTTDATFTDGESEARRLLANTSAHKVSVYPRSVKVSYRNDADEFLIQPPEEWDLGRVRKMDTITVLTFER